MEFDHANKIDIHTYLVEIIKHWIVVMWLHLTTMLDVYLLIYFN